MHSTQAHIMIVDDIAENLQVIGNILHEKGFETSFAQDGKQAIDILNDIAPDLILLDVAMPGMDGFEVCHYLKNNPRTKDIPIIFLTARTDTDSMLHGFNLGAADYVTKPFSAQELLARVNTHVQLKYQRNQLEKVNEWLEIKVKERTLELESANIKLETANNQLIQLDKLKSEFLALISHEIRTPLNGIKVPLQLLKSRVENKNLVQLIDILDESATRLENFSLKAIEITKLKSGTYAYEFRNSNANELIEFSLISTQQKLSEKNIQIVFDQNKEYLIYGDPTLIVKCLDNLIDNACKFSNNNDSVEIVVSKPNKTSTQIRITDKGTGFSDDALQNAFKLFSTNDERSDSHLGLGLFHSQLIMEVHKGTITIDNSKNTGACVTLNFPDKTN